SRSDSRLVRKGEGADKDRPGLQFDHVARLCEIQCTLQIVSCSKTQHLAIRLDIAGVDVITWQFRQRGVRRLRGSQHRPQNPSGNQGQLRQRKDAHQATSRASSCTGDMLRVRSTTTWSARRRDRTSRASTLWLPMTTTSACSSRAVALSDINIDICGISSIMY